MVFVTVLVALLRERCPLLLTMLLAGVDTAVHLCHFVQERVLRQLLCLMRQASVTHRQRFIVSLCQFFTVLLLLLDPFFKFSCVEKKSVNLGRPLNEDLTFKLSAESGSLILKTCLELRLDDTTPGHEKARNFLAVQRVAGER